MKVGVLFPSRFEDPGEFLADARAMETAGVDSVWLHDADDGLDPLLMLAAIAAVTSQLRLGLIPQYPSPLAGASQAKSPSPLVGASQAKSPSPLVGEGRGGGFDQRRIATLQLLSRNRVVVLESPSPARGGGQGGGSSKDWQRVEVPADRDEWAAALARAERDGAPGVLVPFDPRLLDILRHPDDAIDRSDLILAQG